MTNDIAIPPSALRLDAALSCIRRGWPVIPLHDVAMGFCSCNDGSEKHAGTSAGKHPIAARWQFSAITDEEIMRGFMAGRPGMNFGIKTGLDAGLWVLDVDPKHEGDKRLAELVGTHGNLPDTYMQRTGSGGVHYFWLLPGDFTPTNSKGSLPAGLDVRGEGGFVVAAPCVSGIGPYETLMNIPLAQAPDWLLEMIRPRVPADREHVEALEHWDAPALAGVSDRGQRYAMAAVMAELGKLSVAVPGERGFTAYRVACSLIELLNSPWAGLDEQQVKGGFAQAAQRAMSAGGGFDEAEAWTAWSSAARKVGARGRAAPGSGGGGVLLGWSQLGGVPPFGGALPAGNEAFQTWGGAVSPGVSLVSPGLGPSVFPGGERDPLVSLPVSPSLTPDSADVLISMFISGPDLAKMPPPAWLIDQWLVRDSACQIVGKSNDGKSVVALDMAMCVALGRPWRGQRVHLGKVGYVVAEGVAGMGQRYIAWCKKFNDGQDVENICFLPMPIQAADHAGWDVLITACTRMKLDFIIIDTQARVTVGLEENSAREMGMFVDQVERLRRATAACVAMVHHMGKQSGGARGSSAMVGAVTTEVSVSKADDIVTVAITKQKDAAFAAPLALKLSSVETGRVRNPSPGWAAEPDEVLTAAVLLDVIADQAAEWEGLSSKARVIKVLNDLFPGRGATKAEAKDMSAQKGVAKASFYRAWDGLLAEGIVRNVVIEDRITGRFTVTPVDERRSPDLEKKWTVSAAQGAVQGHGLTETV